LLYKGSYTQDDTSNILISESYSCNLYLGTDKYDKQSWLSSERLTNDFGYISSRNSYEVSNYFALEDFSDKANLPAIVEKYSVVTYISRKTRK